MEIDPVIIEPPDPLPTPLVYDDSIDTTNMANVLLIDSILHDKQVFYDSANANTFPIIYDSTSKTDDLLALLRQKFSDSSIQRISLVFHDRGPNVQAPFMNNKIFFEDTDLEVNRTSFSENVSFLISCINEFHVGHIDYLACNTLQYSNWKSYYALLASQTSVVVGASNDATGNMQYSGDWVMENTSEDVMNIYFDANISNYVSLLASSLSQNGGTISLQMDPAGQFVQYSSNGGTYTSIPAASWPITITNSSPSAGNILRVVLTTDIILTTTYTGGVNSWLLAGSSYITFDGSSNYVRINGITDYKGFIDNGFTESFGFDNVIVKNFNTATIGTSSLAANAGWLCTGYFGYGASGNVISGCTNSGPVGGGGNTGGIAGHIVGGYFGIVDISGCTNNGIVSGFQSGGIVGANVGLTGGRVTFINCTNNDAISGNYAGGIAGLGPGRGGVVNFLGCANNGAITGIAGGGIAGGNAGQNSGTATFTACINTGDITGSAGGGIVGYSAGITNGIVDISGCMNTGAISQIYAGGIAGARFADNTIQTCRITNCYSVGDVNGSFAGGITGAAVGYTSSGTYLPKIVNISNCYSLGTINASCGGICGGQVGLVYTGTPTINITNCYSWGVLTDAGSGIVAISLPIPTNQNDIYVADGDWSDASANAVSALIGTPTSLTTGNPGATWTKIANNTTTPYVLSSFNAQLYSPNSASSSSDYTTSAGLFTDSSYNLLYNDQSGNVATTRVFVSKGSTPYYYSYNNNIFTFTNSGIATDTINATLTQSNGILNYELITSSIAVITQSPTPLVASALGQVTYTDISYNIVPDISNNPTYTLRTNVSNPTYDVFSSSTIVPRAFIPNSLFINSTNLENPMGIARDSVGNFYVANGALIGPFSSTIKVYDSTGTTLLRTITLNSGGSGIPGQTWVNLRWLAFDSMDNLYVTNEPNTFVDPSGNGIAYVAAGAATNTYAKTIFPPSTAYTYTLNCGRGLIYYAGYLYIPIRQNSVGNPPLLIKYNVDTNPGAYLTLDLSAELTGGGFPIMVARNPLYSSSPTPFLYLASHPAENKILSISEITGTESLSGGAGAATIALLYSFSSTQIIYSLVTDNSGNLYLGTNLQSPLAKGEIARVTPTGVLSSSSYMTLNSINIGDCRGLLFDGSLNLYVSDTLNVRVIKSQPKTFVFGGPSIVNPILNQNPSTTTYLYDISNNAVITSFNLNILCFKKGTKILCENEIYIPIEELKIGDLVKTYKRGYQKVIMSAHSRLCDSVQSIYNKLYTYSRENNPGLIEDLHLTGGHSLLLDALSEEESNNMQKIDWAKEDFMVEDKYKLLACHSEKFFVSAEQNVEIYHFALEPPENAKSTHVYGVYANGILAESCSKGAMEKMCKKK